MCMSIYSYTNALKSINQLIVSSYFKIKQIVVDIMQTKNAKKDEHTQEVAVS